MGYFRGVSQTIQNELIECFHDVKIFIEININQAPFFAWMIEKPTNIAKKTQYSLKVNRF